MELKHLCLLADAISYGCIVITDLNRCHTGLSGNVEFVNDVLEVEIQGSSRVDEHC